MNKKVERWRVEPGDAIAIAVRIPVDKIDLALNVLNPVIKRSDFVPPDNYPTFYIATGSGTLNGRRTSHKFLNVICDPSPWISDSPAVGGLAWIGAQSSLPNRLMWRHGVKQGYARVTLSVSNDQLSAHTRISANGYSFQVEAAFSPEGEYWEALPNHYCVIMDAQKHRVLKGDEWGVRHDGTGKVSIQKKMGKAETFEAYVGLDTQLGWDYTL